MKRCLILSAISVFLFSFVIAPTVSYAQLTEIKHTFPKIVPVEIEFKNYDSENWWHHLEIEVTNTGKKPIYYFAMTLELDSVYVGSNADGKQMVIPFSFGDNRRFHSEGDEELANPNDPSILPGKSYTFKVTENFIIGWDMRKSLGSFIEPRNGELIHRFTNFGNGTGLLPGGTPFRQRKTGVRVRS